MPPPPGFSLNDVLRKLNDLTVAKKLDWSRDETLLRKRDSIVGHVYTASFRGRRFALYEHRYKYYTDEDEWSWQYRIALELVDLEGRMLWEFTVDDLQESLRGLLETVRHQTAGVDKLFAELMNEEE